MFVLGVAIASPQVLSQRFRIPLIRPLERQGRQRCALRVSGVRPGETREGGGQEAFIYKQTCMCALQTQSTQAACVKHTRQRCPHFDLI
jgi:hypothetical protein